MATNKYRTSSTLDRFINHYFIPTTEMDETMSLSGGLEGPDKRHPSTEHMVTMLKPNPKLTGLQAGISAGVYNLACDLLDELKDSPEVTAGLRKLLEAKDCFVRASLDLDPVDYRDR